MRYLSKLLVFLLFLLAAGSTYCAIVEGKAINVSDGDTITVLDKDRQSIRVRINGIDAPEKSQAFGQRSRENLSRMVAGKEVTADCHKLDRYKRQICKVLVQPADCSSCGKTLDVGHAQIVAGMAWWYREYAKEQTADDRGRYESAENEAKVRKIGLWRDPDSVPPWQYRKKQ